jgi:hypothetical protein
MEFAEHMRQLAIRRVAADMRKELHASRPSTILVPAAMPRFPGHMIRVGMDRTPDWYRKLCAAYPKRRRGNARGTNDPAIARRFVLRSLARLASGKAFRRRDSIDFKVGPVVLAEYETRQRAAADAAAHAKQRAEPAPF